MANLVMLNLYGNNTGDAGMRALETCLRASSTCDSSPGALRLRLRYGRCSRREGKMRYKRIEGHLLPTAMPTPKKMTRAATIFSKGRKQEVAEAHAVRISVGI